MSDVAGFLRDWHRPPYWQRFAGRDVVHQLLGIIIHTIQGFTYHREWQQGSELALEFTGRVGELELQGIDLITLDDRPAIAKRDVLMRPIRAIEALQEIVAPQMTAFFARRAGS
jgi:hypothetical protein